MPAPASKTLLVVEHEADAGLDLMAATFAAATEIEVVRPYLGEAMPEPDVAWSSRFAGLVVLGGEMAAWEDDVAPWLPAVRALLATAVRAKLPTLGICLGAQLLAHATGGLAERGAPGVEIGLVEVTPLPAALHDPFTVAAMVDRFDRFDRFRALSYHGDAVTVLPADAEVLATGELYPNQTFRVGECAWGVQYHPEVSAGGFADWVRSSRTLGGDERAGLLAVAEAAAESQQALATGHAEGFLQASGIGSPA